MKYIINIYKNKDLFKTDTNPNGYPWKILEIYEEAIGLSKKEGFRIVEQSTGTSGGYTLLFNEKTMSAVVYSYETILITDFLDSTGQKILAGKKYRGDVYQLNQCDGEFYLRNLTLCNSVYNCVKDIEGSALNQNTIDDFELKAE